MASLETARFQLDGPRDLLAKLRYDLRRLQALETSTREEVIYAGFDCAIGAWSMVDWVYHAMPQDKRVSLGCIAQGGSRTPKRMIEVFKQRVWGLDVCRQLATGAKHFVVSDTPIEGFKTDVLEVGLRTRDAAGNTLRTGKAF